MPLYIIFLLAIIQGLTEFLPVSSSGHLVLVHGIDQGKGAVDNCNTNKLMDVAVHVGTLFAVLIYFYKDVIKLLFGLKDIALGDVKSDNSRLLQFIIIATIPVVIAGFILHQFSPSFLCSVEVVAWATIIFAVFLWYSDRFKPNEKNLNQMTYKNAVIIGLSQILALIPGTSRSGITMTAARFLNFDRVTSARFSLLLSMTAISGAGLLGGLDLIEHDSLDLTYDIFLAMILSFVSGLVAIFLMMKWLGRFSFTPFVIYRLILGFGLLAFVYL